MPYQGDTTPAAAQPQSTPNRPIAEAVAVIPAVDLYLGRVTIMTKGGTAHYGHPEPRLIADALARAVRPTRWCEASRTLTVTVAAVGKRGGLERQFQFPGDRPA